MRVKHLRWLLILFLASSAILPAADELFEFKPVVDGVYAAIAKPTFRTNCNAAIIVRDDGVLVVDTESKPSAARAVIAEIKKITDKPVKYVVITHFHGDHFQGADAYRSEWPGVDIISSDATRESIIKRGIPKMKAELVSVPREMEKLQADLEKTTDPQEKEHIEEKLRGAEAYVAELKTMRIALPTETFTHSLTLPSDSRPVELLWLGRAHTDGDVFVYLPKDRVIVTGDALHGATPTMRDSSPYDWIRTLDKVEKLDFDYVIGGHGDHVLRGNATFELWKQYFTDLMAETADAVASGATLDQARQRLIPALEAKYADRFPAGMFAETVTSNVEKAYRVVSGQSF
jgi:glyoxylase-like metal-dependent hydrolase (beta-lactamase superfamily II)